MQNNRFVVLTGHLSNYPLSDLVGILRHQRKSGRLLIEYAKGPATFFFQDGELILSQPTIGESLSPAFELGFVGHGAIGLLPF